jgi:Asp-tRNA(Asn)/Glu-tRNA(Gln) amidotransferase A subunit family amidase
MTGSGVPFHGIPAGVPEGKADSIRKSADMLLRPETRAMFLKAVDALRAAGAEVIVSDSILPPSFAKLASRVSTYAYMKDGTDKFLATFGPAAYHSAADYARVVGGPLYTSSIGTEDNFRNMPGARLEQRVLATDASAERDYLTPRRAMLAEYLATLDRLKLDGFVYPAIQMPPVDESMPQDGRVSEGPHSATSWVNMIGVPAIVVSAGYYASGLPFGLEFSARPWSDHALLAVAAAWEQATPKRKAPTLVEAGLLSVTPARAGKRTIAAVSTR